MDYEHLYQLMEREAWPAVIAFVHRRHAAIKGDARAEQAVQAFEDEFFRRLPARRVSSLERLVLLHSGGMRRLAEGRFEQAVERLVFLKEKAGDGRAALAYARFCPENARCRAAIARYEGAEPDEAPHAQSEAIHLLKTRRPAGADRTRPLFRSRQEEVFFAALRETFPTFYVYPNVALQAVVDFEAIRSALTRAERAFFFKGLVDAVVFDPQDAYRPQHFFELDSPHHDAPAQRRRDAHKDRILALAGQRLYRIRVRKNAAPSTGRSEFATLIAEVILTTTDDR